MPRTLNSGVGSCSSSCSLRANAVVIAISTHFSWLAKRGIHFSTAQRILENLFDTQLDFGYRRGALFLSSTLPYKRFCRKSANKMQKN